MENIKNLFKEKNLKLTPQRINIYNYVLSNCEHPTAEIVYKNIQHIMPTISLATVYKTLNVLVKAGLLNELNVGDNNIRYDSNIFPHAHVKCSRCSKIKDINCKDINGLEKFFETNLKFSEIEKFDLFLYGFCHKCKESRI